ncbi:MAG: TolC family protein, partial [Draconibacterium sp.]|nr:TolC family protein [Draconibacterium sp.]
MKSLLTLFLGILLCMTTLNSNAQERNLWDLQKCIDYALENNIQIKQQALGTDYQQNLVNQAKSDRLPNLNGQIGNNYSFGRSLTYENTYENVNSTSVSGGIGTNVTVFNGFTLKNTIDLRELDLQASIADLQKAKDDIMLAIAAQYLEILFAEELALVTEANIEVTNQQIERTQQLVEAGSLARGAILEIEAQLAREELQLVNDQNRIQIAYLTLYQFLELPIAESFKIEKPTLPEIGANVSMANSMDVYQNAMHVRPEIKAAQLRVKSMKKQLEVAKGSQYPNLSFGANYYNNYNDNYQRLNQSTGEIEVIPLSDQLKNNERYGFGFTLNVPIFNRNMVKNNISNAQLQVMDYEYRLQSSANVLRKDIEQAYTNALAAL